MSGSARLLFPVLFVGALAACLAASPAGAIQKRIAGDNAEIAATISARELTRIYLTNDRIASLAGDTRTFAHQHDRTAGDLFVKPADPDAIVNLFITSEKGKTYKLLLTPRDVPAEQLEIDNPALRTAAKEEAAMPYRQALLKAVRAMILGRTPSGYAAVAVPLGDGPGRIRATRRWSGGRFAGTAYRIVPDGSAATERAALFAGLSGDGAAAVWIASAPDAGGALRAVVVERAGP